MLTEHTMLSEIEERCDAIEESYEFMLGYAGKGLPIDEGTQIRYYLQRAAGAITGLAKTFSEVVEKQRIEPTEKYEAFLAVLDRDARDSLAAIELVLVQTAISSQMIDNLNASIHLRALLTDIFLLHGILRDRMKIDEAAAS
jgi:hypothetical protein